MAENLIRADPTKVRGERVVAEETTVLIHSDGVTPLYFVVLALQTVFDLSYELAEHITWVAQIAGTAPVLTRPRHEAERLVDAAHAAARLDGFPLTFSLDREYCIPRKDGRKSVFQFGLSVIFLLLAVCIAIADGAGGFTF